MRFGSAEADVFATARLSYWTCRLLNLRHPHLSDKSGRTSERVVCKGGRALVSCRLARKQVGRAGGLHDGHLPIQARQPHHPAQFQRRATPS